MPLSAKQTAAVEDFMTQCIAGTILGHYRLLHSPKDDPALYNGKLVNMVAQYLNVCWMGLMREDDDFVLKSFEDMRHRSPVCLIHFLFELAQRSLPQKLPFVPYSGKKKISKEMECDLVREPLTDLCRGAVQHAMQDEALMAVFSHKCSGNSVEKLRQEWKDKGGLDDPFFRFGRAVVDDTDSDAAEGSPTLTAAPKKTAKKATTKVVNKEKKKSKKASATAKPTAAVRRAKAAKTSTKAATQQEAGSKKAKPSKTKK